MQMCAWRKETFKNWDQNKEDKNNLLFVFFTPSLPGLEISVPLSLFKCLAAVTISEEEQVWMLKINRMNNNMYFVLGSVLNTRKITGDSDTVFVLKDFTSLFERHLKI